jgi:hypothetical protein
MMGINHTLKDSNMKLKNFTINFVLLLPLIGSLSPFSASPQKAIAAPISTNEQMTSSPVPLAQKTASSRLDLAGAERDTFENVTGRKPLPKSFYSIHFWTSNNLFGTHVGVAVRGKALLSSNHLLPPYLPPENVSRIKIFNSYGDVHDIKDSESFSILLENGYTTIVFKENIIPEENVSPLGDVNSLSKGDQVSQAVVNGAPVGTYPTKFKGHLTLTSAYSREYQAFTVFSDLTVGGDSGSPLYVDGVVYGINNSGNGIYGAITNPEQIYRTIDNITTRLNHQEGTLALESSNEAGQ